MAQIFTKCSFTLRRGEIRVPWKQKVTVPDDDILDFILKDPYHSKDNRWKSSFEILGFDKAENNKKYASSLSSAGKITLTDVEVDTANNVDGSVGFMQDRGRTDKRDPNYAFDRGRKISEFPILNNYEQQDVLGYFRNNDDKEALKTILEEASMRGDSKTVDDINNILRSEEIRRVSEVNITVNKEIEEKKVG